ESMSPAERQAVATFLSRATAGGSGVRGPRACTTAAVLRPEADTNWNGWGVNAANERFQRRPGLTAAQVPTLALKWAFGFEGETSAATQPVVVGNRVFIGSNGGTVYSLGLDDGCLQWSFKAAGGIRAAMTIVSEPDGGASAIVGDLAA